ncbi:TonB-dependent receptor [Sphingobium algorifonticola]|uniref:TonB-dependent receptor n=1 Tax=Sphingobium algorifonticola TaxID=2008318 RepID=A0A437JA06_9SPHN|nr:TonB-dependent receptor [Sphingobium algorifonticola]RVT42346.1 TonB-dependent receptor [Sphingobium algorifonticola]
MTRRTWIIAALLSGAVNPAIALASGADEVQASDAAAETEQSGLADIIVTARRVSENLQTTPVAVTAFGPEVLARNSAFDIRAIATQAPNVNLQAGGNAAGGNNTQIFIRGIGQDDFLPTADPGVGVYVDGVYLGRSVGGLLKAADLSQVEVLRGPQGTLFGRNTIGGALNIRTADPELGVVKGNIELNVGNYDMIGVNAALNLPLGDTVAARVSGTYRKRDGYGESTTDGTEFGNEDYGLIRGKLLWEASDAVTVTLSGDWYQQRQNNNPVAVYGLVCADGTLGVCSTQAGTNIPNVGNSSIIALYNGFVGGPSGNPFTNAELRPLTDPYDSGATAPSQDDAEIWGVSSTVDWAVSDSLSFKSITAFRKLNAQFQSDNDGASVNIASTDDDFRQRQFSQEVQAILDLDRLNAVLGLYYFNEKSSDLNTVNITPGLYASLNSSPVLVGQTVTPCALAARTPIPGTPFFSYGSGFGCTNNIANTTLDNELLVDQTVRVRNFAAFGQGTFQATEKLSFTAGLRLTYEKKFFDYFQQRLGVSASLGTPYYAVAPSSAKDSWTDLSPRFGAEYRFTPKIMGYASYARGFKSGTFNGRATNTQGVASVDPETVNQFEVGLKTQTADNRLRVNVAGFYSIYRDLQLQSVVQDPAQGLLINLVNAGRARVYGAELEILAKPIPAIELGLAGGYTNSRITEIDAAVAAATGVADGNTLKKAPKWNFTASGQVTQPIDGVGDVLARIEYVYVGKQFHDAANNPDTVEDSYGLLNGRLALTIGDRYSIAVYGRNLTDEVYFNSLFRTGGGQSVAYVARGREFGVSLKWDF